MPPHADVLQWEQAVEPGAMVITDAWGGYNGLQALEGTEALIEGFGILSGRPVRSV